MFWRKLFRKFKNKPKYKFGDFVSWNELTLIVNDYVYEKDGSITYILFDWNTCVFYENIFENEITKID
jgi:hypothetical protein